MIAKTSLSKSMILQTVLVLGSQSITLIILPLQVIGFVQTHIYENRGPSMLPKCRHNQEKPVGADTEWTLPNILISTELAISNQLRAVAVSPKFQACNDFLVVRVSNLFFHTPVSIKCAIFLVLNELIYVVSNSRSKNTKLSCQNPQLW